MKPGPQEPTEPVDRKGTLVLKVLRERQVRPDLLVLLDHSAQLVLVVVLEQWGPKVEQECKGRRDQRERLECQEDRG